MDEWAFEIECLREDGADREADLLEAARLDIIGLIPLIHLEEGHGAIADAIWTHTWGRGDDGRLPCSRALERVPFEESETKEAWVDRMLGRLFDVLLNEEGPP